jgi:hypothetical protein
MFFEAPVNHPMPIIAQRTVWADGAESPAPPALQPPPTEEQARAAEAIFAARQHESDQVAGMLGMWAGTMVLKDLATESFTEPVVELKLKPKADPRKNKEGEE